MWCLQTTKYSQIAVNIHKSHKNHKDLYFADLWADDIRHSQANEEYPNVGMTIGRPPISA